MVTCESCGREFVSRHGPAGICPHCGWRQGSPRYWLDKDPEAEMVETHRESGPIFDYSERILKEWK